MADPVSSILTLLKALVKGVLKIRSMMEQVNNNTEDCGSLCEYLDGVTAVIESIQKETPSVMKHGAVANALELLRKDLESGCKIVKDCKKMNFTSHAMQADHIGSKLKKVRTCISEKMGVLDVSLGVCDRSIMISIRDILLAQNIHLAPLPDLPHQREGSSVSNLVDNVQSLTLLDEQTMSKPKMICPLRSTNNKLEVYPPKLCFPAYEDKETTSCPVTLTNKMNHYVGVWIIEKEKYTCKNNTILKPHSTLVVPVIMKKNELHQNYKFKVVMIDVQSKDDLEELEPPFRGPIRSDSKFMERVEKLQCLVYYVTLDVETVKPSTVIRTFPKKTAIVSLDVHPIKTWIMICSEDYVDLWDYQKEKHIARLQFHAQPFRCTKFIAKENWFALGDCCGKIYIHGYNDNGKTHEITSIEAHSTRASVDLLAVHPTENCLLSSSFCHNKIMLWTWGNGSWTKDREFNVGVVGVHSLMFNPGQANGTFTCVTSAKRIQAWNVRHPYTRIFIPHGPFRAAQFTHNNNLVTLYPGEESSYIWGTHLEIVHAIGMTQHSMRHIATHSKRALLATSFDNGTLCLWDTQTYRLEKFVETGGIISQRLGFLEDVNGHIRIFAEFSSTIAIWKVKLPIGSKN